MRRSPCLECEIHVAGGDKNGDRCLRCTKRIEYVAALEGRSTSMPVEMTDMAQGKWSEEEVRYLRDNFHGKTDAELAAELGRAASSVTMKRMAMGLRKAASWRTGWERIKERKAAALAQADADLAKCPPEAPETPAKGGIVDTSALCPDCGVGLGMLHRHGCSKLKIAELVPVTAPDFTLINFKQHEPIYERLKAAAERDFRTPELQALYYIHQALERENGTGDQRRPADRAA